MNINVEWDNSEKTIILQTYGLHWGWEDVHAARAQSVILMDSVSHKVHFIINVQKSPRIPSNYMEHVQAIVQDVHPNMGLSITVTTNPLVKELFYVFSAMTGGVDFEYQFVLTVDEARTILHNWVGRS